MTDAPDPHIVDRVPQPLPSELVEKWRREAAELRQSGLACRMVNGGPGWVVVSTEDEADAMEYCADELQRSLEAMGER